ncbi:MAG: hypothetical protein PHU77_06275 [Simplicispira sp.]|nr:hypothetical protein [Simplicispira sp.]
MEETIVAWQLDFTFLPLAALLERAVLSGILPVRLFAIVAMQQNNHNLPKPIAVPGTNQEIPIWNAQ